MQQHRPALCSGLHNSQDGNQYIPVSQPRDAWASFEIVGQCIDDHLSSREQERWIERERGEEDPGEKGFISYTTHVLAYCTVDSDVIPKY